MAFNPYESNLDYDADALLKQFSEYRDRHGEECEYVKCEHRKADYSVMDSYQRAYYLYWRDELSRGRCLKSDRGYTKLRLCEIVNSDMDPQEGMDELNLLLNTTRMHGTPQSEIGSVMFDYAMVNDLDLPIIWMGKGSVRSYMVVSELMAYPVRRVSMELMRVLAGGPRIHADGVDDAKHAALFNDCLTAIDRFLMENTGKGVAKTYSEGLTTELYKVFLYLPYGKDKDYQVTYEKLRSDGVFGDFMLGLFMYTRKVLCRQINEKGPATPSSFNKEFRKIVDRIAEEGLGEVPYTPREWRGTTRVHMSSKERALVDMGAALEAQFGTAEKPKAILNVDRTAPKQHVSPHLKNDIERNWNVEVDQPQNYIPSGFSNPDYRSFNEAQRKFYCYWRGQTRKGRYSETDYGYLWLYLCEIVNIVADKQEMMDQLLGLHSAYGEFDEDNLIGHVCFDYAIVHGLTIPDPSLYESNVTACLVMQQFLDGKDARPDRSLLMFLSGISDRTMSREFDDDCVGMTCMMLRKIQSQMGEQGTTIEEHCGLEKTRAAVDVFGDLRYFSQIRRVRLTYWNYIYNAAFDDSLKNIMKAAFSASRMKRTNRPVKIAKFTAFDMECKDLMKSAVDEWYEGKEVAGIKEMASSMVLDRDAVKGAESALRDVTKMMSSQQAEAEAPKEMPAMPETRKDGTWDGLMGALTDIQKGYLRAILDGRGRDFLSENRINALKVEEAINTAAMDTVGDSIVEDGRIYDEYIDAVSSALR